MRIYWGLYTDTALVSSVWESDGDKYELSFVTVSVICTGHEKKTVVTSEDSAHCMEPAGKCEKLSPNSNVIIKGKKSLIVLFYQLLIISFCTEKRPEF